MANGTPLVLAGSARAGGRLLFEDLRLELVPGRWTSLLGPSGVGKSTLLRLIAGLPTGVLFEGRIEGRRPAALMAQDAGLLPWLTARQNVLLGARLRGEKPNDGRALELLASVGLADRAEQRPATLSGGQRQRVALARTLMENHSLVLLDEPFSALDAKSRMQMQDLAATLLTGRTVLMVTHDPAEAARISDVIVVMTEAGLSTERVPAMPVPRAPDAAEVLTCQAALLAQLMKQPVCFA